MCTTRSARVSAWRKRGLPVDGWIDRMYEWLVSTQAHERGSSDNVKRCNSAMKRAIALDRVAAGGVLLAAAIAAASPQHRPVVAARRRSPAARLRRVRGSFRSRRPGECQRCRRPPGVIRSSRHWAAMAGRACRVTSRPMACRLSRRQHQAALAGNRRRATRSLRRSTARIARICRPRCRLAFAAARRADCSASHCPGRPSMRKGRSDHAGVHARGGPRSHRLQHASGLRNRRQAARGLGLPPAAPGGQSALRRRRRDSVSRRSSARPACSPPSTPTRADR